MKLTEFSPKQQQVLTWWLCPQWEALICDGAVRSGKTYSMGLSFFLWAMTSFNRQQFGLCGKTIHSVWRNLLQSLLPQLRRMGMHVTRRRSENLLILRCGRRENRFLIFGGMNEGSAALIQGATLAGVFLDETALMPRSFVEQAIARCSVVGSKLWFNCNPEGPEHWFYKEWVQQADKRHALRLHFTMEDNPSLTEEIRQRYHRAYSGVFYRRFVLGEWVMARGLVYDGFDRERDVRPVPDGPFDLWRVSIDYGTVNPASFGVWGRCGGVWYRVEEYYYDSRREGRQKADEEYAGDLEKLIGNRPIQRILVDPSAASFIEVLRRRGLPVRRAVNDVADGIRITAELLRSGRIVICEPCHDCLREMALYCWDESTGRDAPRKEHDHAMDEMRYFAMDLAGGRKSAFAATSVRRSALPEPN